VGTLTKKSALSPDELSARQSVQRGLAYWQGERHMINRNVRHFAALTKAAGKEIGYLENPDVRAVFDELGTEIVERFKL
jgi:hypothetical protein